MLRKARPGESPIDDISGLKIKGLSKQSELDLAEAKNIRKAVSKYLAKKPTRRMAPFDFAWSLKLHREMFGDVWTWAGQLRTTEVNLGVPPDQLESGLYGLLKDLAYWAEHDVPLLEQAVMLHHKAVHLHPFKNGNGRWSRMLANTWLKRHGSAITEWPDAKDANLREKDSPIRTKYLAAIKEADQGDYGPLLELHRRFTARH